MYVVRSEALDDFVGAGCPMCKAAERVERTWLRGLLDEVGDAKVRAGLERRGGLCADHVRVLVEVAGESQKTLGLGVVLEVLLSQARDELGRRRRQWRSRAGRVPRDTEPASSCGACASVQLREDAYAELLLAGNDAALQQRAADPRSALCRPHLAAVLGRVTSERRTAAVGGAASSKVDDLLAGVARSIDAHRVGSEVGPDAHEVILRDAPDWLAGSGGTARTWAPGGVARQRWRRGSRS